MLKIFGSKRTNKILGRTEKTYICTHCKNTKHWALVRVSKWFTVFSLPVIPYNIKHVHLCPICKNWIQLPKEDYQKMSKIKKRFSKRNMRIPD